MSTKEQRREIDETTTVKSSSTTEFATSPSYMQQREEQHSVNRALESDQR